ncbi:MAG TPA: tetratricopeptide repeat protein [Candidatus Acidoferrum sp.]|nr:tetratricopeptide repeat protein [Candidatus Acidoferrum sp.]
MKTLQSAPRFSFRLVLAILFFFSASRIAAQQIAPFSQHPAHPLPQEGIYLVFPFENVAAPARLDWIGEGLEELTIQRLSAAGQQVYSRGGLLNDMDRYGLPASAKLSRATMLHVAQDLDADFVVYGNFTSDGKNFTVNARVLRVNPTALLPVVQESGALASLMDLHTRLAWRLLETCDARFPVTLPEFAKLQRPLQLAAFEQYIRGLLANDDVVRVRDLKEAARLEPDWPDPAFALGQFYLHRNDCYSALLWLAKVPPSHERSVEANFSVGVCRLRLSQPEKAEQVFAALQEDLRHNLVSGADLPEILNNLALARARLGDAASARTALSRASDIDPDEDDYPFNLGLLALRANDLASAATHFREAVHRAPDNPEDRAFLIYTLEKARKKSEVAEAREAALEALGSTALPIIKLEAKKEAASKYERIKPELDTTTLRLELRGPDSLPSPSAEAAPPADTPATHVRLGRLDLAAGHLDAAEKEFRAALLAEPHNASAHQEIAEIHRRRGKLEEAIQELQLSLAARDSAAVRITLARIYLEQKKPDLARAEVEKAVKLAPNYADAKALLERLQQAKPTGGKK